MKNSVGVERITSGAYLIRGRKFRLDKDLAELNRAEGENVERFSAGFMFALDRDEIKGIS